MSHVLTLLRTLSDTTPMIPSTELYCCKACYEIAKKRDDIKICHDYGDFECIVTGRDYYARS